MRLSTSSNPTLRNRLLTDFLNDIRKYPVLTPDEEDIMFAEYSSPNTSAIRKEEIENTIICSNLRFVYASAKMYEKDPSKVMDIVNEAVIGMMSAFPSYDPTRGIRFMSFAVNYMRRDIDHFIKHTDKIVRRTNEARIGVHIRKIRAKFFAENGREPSDEEIKDILMETNGVKVVNNSDIVDVSMVYTDANLDDDDTTCISDCGEYAMLTASRNDVETYIEQESAVDSVRKALMVLNPKEREVIKLLFGIDCDREHSADEVALLIAKDGEKPLTAMRINQIRKSSIEKMQRYAKKIAC